MDGMRHTPACINSWFLSGKIWATVGHASDGGVVIKTALLRDLLGRITGEEAARITQQPRAVSDATGFTHLLISLCCVPRAAFSARRLRHSATRPPRDDSKGGPTTLRRTLSARALSTYSNPLYASTNTFSHLTANANVKAARVSELLYDWLHIQLSKKY